MPRRIPLPPILSNKRNMDFHAYDFSGKRALIRVDFNVPLNEGRVTDDTRIRAALPTIQRVLEGGGSCVLMSHLGRPKGREPEFSLSQIVSRLDELLGLSVKMAPDCIGEEVAQLAEGLGRGEVLLLENLRYHSEEKAGDEGFAKKLAKLGDVYINDAFGTAHRAHASTAVIARFMEDSMAGALLATEVKNIEKVLKSAERPYVAIIGGAKVSSKIMILENLMDKVDDIIIGGGMAYTFMKAQGGEIGASLVEEDFLEEARKILKKAENRGVRLHLPEDSILADRFAEDAEVMVGKSMEIPEGWMGLDIGPEATEAYRKVISNAKTILWNGPMGVFEMESFSAGTITIGKAVAETTENHGAFSLVGGGDSVAAVNRFGLADSVSYISTGGGAMLEYLEGKELPGIKAVMED